MNLQLGIYGDDRYQAAADDMITDDTVQVECLPGVYLCYLGFNGVLLHPTIGIGSSVDIRTRLFVDHIMNYACVEPIKIVYTEKKMKTLLHEDYACGHIQMLVASHSVDRHHRPIYNSSLPTNICM